jgi:amino acid adenylation domain-containing protein
MSLVHRTAKSIDDRALSTVPPLRFDTHEGLFPLSFSQRMFWFLDQLESDTPAHNLPRLFKIKGKLNIESLRNAFRTLLRRHNVLRTVFVAQDGELFQRVLSHVEIDFVVQDFTSLTNSSRMMETLTIASKMACRPFDLNEGPLLRLCLVRLSTEEHVLVLVMHHIITDGWSMSILFKELTECYEQLAANQQPRKPKLLLQYTDFACWQMEHITEKILQKEIEYWRDNLQGCPDFLEIPGDRPRPAIQSHRGSIESFSIDETLTLRINELCRREGVTLYMALLSIFLVLLSRYTAKEDIPVGTPTAGRNDADLSELIGCFVNTLVMRGDLSGDPSFSELLQRVRTVALGAYAHQGLPFAELLAKLSRRRSLGYTPLFQAMFILQNAPKQVIRLPGLVIEELEFDSGLAKFDLTLEIVENEGCLHCQFEYSSDLFDASTIQRMARHFQNLTLNAINDPSSSIAKLKMLGTAERQQLTLDWNQTSAPYPVDVTIAEAFAAQVRKTPNSVALLEAAQAITFVELDRRANQVANELIAKGVSPKTPIGVYMKRSIDAIVAILAVLKANCPYVPLDTSQPKHRLNLLLKSCRAEIVLTTRALLDDLPERTQCIVIEGDAVLWANQASTASPFFPNEDNIAYIISTSGTTGVPKGVAGTHRATMNRLEWMYQTFPFSPNEVCCHKTALSFVDSIWEVFGPLLRGIPNVIVSEDVVIEPERLIALFARYRVTRIVLVPTLLNVLLECFPDLSARIPDLKLWTVSGEYLPIALAKKFRAALPEATLLNLYGSSEVAGDATFYVVGEHNPTRDVVPIGKPLSNTQVYVLDANREPVPIGVPGTLHVGGDCLAQGYWLRPDLTGERFIPNPFCAKYGLIFDTGDRAKWLADGNLEFLGRLDTQIKVRGFRIELAEIESNLIEHPVVQQAAVTVTGSLSESQQLTGYVVSRDRSTVVPEELRRFLKERLPDYMIPAFFVQMGELPLLASGKVDRRALPAPAVEEGAPRRERVEARNNIERELSMIWCEVLATTEFGVTDDFFILGGDSLRAMQVLARVRKVFQVEVSIRTLFDGATIEALAHEIENAEASGAKVTTAAITPRVYQPTSADALKEQLRKLSSHEIEALLDELRREEGELG